MTWHCGRGRPEGGNGRYAKIHLAFPLSFGVPIARFHFAWEEITKDPWVLSTVAEGLSLEFTSVPSQSHIPENAHMNPSQFELCDTEVNSLIEKGAVIECEAPSFISGISLIPKKTGGFRPIINLKGLNQFIVHNHFKLDGIQTVRNTLRKRDWLAK